MSSPAAASGAPRPGLGGSLSSPLSSPPRQRREGFLWLVSAGREGPWGRWTVINPSGGGGGLGGGEEGPKSPEGKVGMGVCGATDSIRTLGARGVGAGTTATRTRLEERKGVLGGHPLLRGKTPQELNDHQAPQPAGAAPEGSRAGRAAASTSVAPQGPR